MKNRNKTGGGRYNIMIMRSQGEVMNLAVSPLLLAAAFAFGLVFVVVSVVVINKYGALLMDHSDLQKAYSETSEELSRLQSLYTYQASVADDYANLMRALNRADPRHDEEGSRPAATEPERPGAPEAAEPDEPAEVPLAFPAGSDGADGEEGTEGRPQAPTGLEEWAALLPDAPAQPEHVLDVENLQISGGRFSFSLTNEEGDGRAAAQGNLLMVFEVIGADGQKSLRPFPEFNLISSDPDFRLGPGYNIRAGKTVSGRLALPQGATVRAVMVAAKSRGGQIVMKKSLRPAGRQ